MVNPQILSGPTHSRRSLYCAAFVGVIIAVVADLFRNPTSPAFVRLREALQLHIYPFTDGYGSIVTAIILGVTGLGLCWVYSPPRKIDAFSLGVAIFAMLALLGKPPPETGTSAQSGAAPQNSGQRIFGIASAHAAQVSRSGTVTIELIIKSKTATKEGVEPLVTIRDPKTAEILGRERMRTTSFEITRPVGGYILEISAPGLRRTRTHIEISDKPDNYKIEIEPSVIPLGIQQLYAPRIFRLD